MICQSVCAHECNDWGDQKRELELQAVVELWTCPVTKLRSSGRTGNVLDHWAISPGLYQSLSSTNTLQGAKRVEIQFLLSRSSRSSYCLWRSLEVASRLLRSAFLWQKVMFFSLVLKPSSTADSLQWFTLTIAIFWFKMLLWRSWLLSYLWK